MAQSTFPFLGARAQGIANTSACLSDVWALYNNVAGLASIKHTTAAFTYHAIPSFHFFNRMGAVIATRVNTGAAALGVHRFGDGLYNEQTLSAGAANTFGLASLGLRLNYLQYRAAGLETRSALTVSFGGIATLTPKLLAGAHIVNINQPIINDRTGEKIATCLIAGISYLPSDKVIIATEIEKKLGSNSTLKTGIEYQAFRKIAFRTGFNLHPQAAFFGLGFDLRKFKLDYAVQSTVFRGLHHEASATYRLRKR